ncbi:hypothetical protein D1007_14894 [Hordeum vulgare]|uniref:Uncharacterized protein n=1 Tax=Hordeum vulgare subsp. vulgare TaxID=112509 RepID=A0A8I6YTB4_HORVV|nr:uncharacterized protein LOC123396054 [Hordeum vulgare subsp. vulgare]KAE8808793.1 hypothetical protein D1007_14894 [Hordeum vulgare]KAI4989682.1 hypothetical protein ZWY2020_038045 [Hordeum vulgare]
MATGCVPGALRLVSWRGASSSSSHALVRLGPRVASFAAPPRPRHRHLRPAPVAHMMLRVPPARCLSPATPESPLEPPSLWQKALQKCKGVSWKHLASLVLLLGCIALGYSANKGDPHALLIIDILDKANKAYKPSLEFTVLLIAVYVSLFSR